MTVHSGGPHILLFERDQQLTALLTSEFQLAGYECHAARTAVEVFDAIARYPIRLVLVNLAQAAAGRREFWVALDAQRRGRGVQVFTFRCMNIAGYGPDDPDERARAVLTDMEVDGMLGVMNLVDAVRSRIPGSTTGSFPRAQAPLSTQESGKFEAVRPASQPGLQSLSMPQPTNQPTAPIAMTATQGSSPEQPAIARTPTFTDKIRAVIYPGNRSAAQTPEANWVPRTAPNAPNQSSYDPAAGPNAFNSSRSAGMAQAAPLPPPTPTTEESSLEQLSRMVQDSAAPASQPETAMAPQAALPTPPAATPVTPTAAQQPRNALQAPPAPAIETLSIGDQPLRASPIEDLPDERPIDRRNGMSNAGVLQSAQAAQENATPTLQLAAVNLAQAQAQQLREEPAVEQPQERERLQLEETAQSVTDEAAQPQEQENERDRLIDEVLVPQSGQTELQVMDILQAPSLRKRSDLSMTSEDVLLDIVQSLPPMNALPTPATPTSPVPQHAPVLNGRATRSLANVLLEGHLVAENRLEVAQSIQRMLRGVDMNYQLGEILLMFKLLTPDQLLAASLVSYGLISAPQISALGRIRQELHSLGLEYDLESLLVLFRMLTPDQLREVRASWTA
jgi:hypothetical protein